MASQSEMYSTVAWACSGAGAKFSRIQISRNVAGDDDVTFDVKYCGICHTDVLVSGNRFGPGTHYPCVPGHEVAGVVTRVGRNVELFQVSPCCG